MRTALAPHLPQRTGYVGLGLRAAAIIIDLALMSLLNTLLQVGLLGLAILNRYDTALLSLPILALWLLTRPDRWRASLRFLSPALVMVLPWAIYLWVVAGAKHNQALPVAGDEYRRRVTEFFDRYLAGEPAGDPRAGTPPVRHVANLSPRIRKNGKRSRPGFADKHRQETRARGRGSA